ncbi:MAG: alkaline phosphatase family protein [Desulfobacterales bacterium]|jgi:2,3-bisphosphoglycerate-independent phosphoglycerate mutase|nr:alkaline phosphatase family protein [Desulfobacterales bacterium]
MPSKCVLILLDGLGDRSYEQLMHQTPLQAARTPALDYLAEMGASGLYHASLVGQALPSENAHFAMFGYEKEEFPGRGALEALGAGIDLNPEDVAVLAHFVSVRESKGSLVLVKDRPVASEDETVALIKAVEAHEEAGVNARFVRTKKLDGIIMLQGNVAPFVTDSDPIRKGAPLVEIKPWTDYRQDIASCNTARALKAYLVNSYRKLKNHPVNKLRVKKGLPPVNAIATQRAGRLKTVVPFARKYGLRGLSIASSFVYWGLAAYIGLDCRKAADTKDPGKDIARRLVIARKALKTYDFIHVHTKAPDAAAHKKDPVEKKRVIEFLDRGIGEAIGPLMNDPEVLIIVTADHCTPSEEPLIHSGETVPLTFFGRGIRRDRVNQFDEISAANGALGCLRGKELTYLILNHLERAKLHGIMDTPDDQPFWPGHYEPFRIEQDRK